MRLVARLLTVYILVPIFILVVILGPDADKLYHTNNRPFYIIERILVDWLSYFRQHGIPINTTVLQLMAQDIYCIWEPQFGKIYDTQGREPQWTLNWANKFRKAWNLKYFKLVGEAASIDMASIKEELDEIKKKLEGYALEDIYNCGESGLYLCWMSPWTLDVVKIAGMKPTKSAHVSVLFCTNATGTDKQKPFILSKLTLASFFIHLMLDTRY